MSALEAFDFDGTRVRVTAIDGEAWFIASDVASVLGYSAPSAMTRTLDEDEKGLRSVHTLGGEQLVAVVSEAGVFSAILRSRIERARTFRRWVTHEVLPSIHRTGAYVAPETPEQLMARAVVQAQEIIARKDEQIAVLSPRAGAWDELADSGTDYAVADAAAILNRAGIATGRDRLFATLADIRWIYRGEKRRWRPYASAIDAGYMAERAQPPHRDADGILVPSPPQVRITARGVERLRIRLGRLELATT